MKGTMFLVMTVLFYGHQVVPIADNEHAATLIRFLQQYKRPITVLEISHNALDYSLMCAGHFNNGTFVGLSPCRHAVLVAHNACTMVPYRNVVLLNPPFDKNMFETLARCEYFDVVIMHDLTNEMLQKDYQAVLCCLGDHTFIISGKNMEYCAVQKRGLDIARWSQHVQPLAAQPRYPVYSDFNQKYMIKRGQQSQWVRGINLITFIMLRGIRPSDQTIIKTLKAYKHADHNDLVLGNIVVQGQKLVPIDFNDQRRNAKAKRCIKAALKMFKKYDRFANPAQALKAYSEMLH